MCVRVRVCVRARVCARVCACATAALLRFTSPTYTVSECAGVAQISLVRADPRARVRETAVLDAAGGSALDGFDFAGLAHFPVRRRQHARLRAGPG